MDHICHQCGHEIEEGTPFCRQCGAPQIRIPGIAEPSMPVPPSETPGEVAPPPVPTVPAVPTRPAGVDWAHAVPAAAWVAAWTALLFLAWVVPLIGLVFFTFTIGVVGITVYQRRVPEAVVTPGIGARVGAVSGLFGFAGFACVMSVAFLLLRGRFREILQQVMQQTAAANPDPAVQDALKQMSSPAVLAGVMTIMMIFLLVVFVACSAAGGAVGARFYRPSGSDTRRTQQL